MYDMITGDRHRLALIRRVLEKACAGTESFHEGGVGAHLAYLALAIAAEPPGNFVDWSDEVADDSIRSIRTLFLLWFPPHDRVWEFIRL